jgi:ribosome-interacting GTPase 1
MRKSEADSLYQCNAIHKSIVEQFRVAIVYGRSVKHQPQRVGLSHELADEDISKYTAGASSHVV